MGKYNFKDATQNSASGVPREIEIELLRNMGGADAEDTHGVCVDPYSM
jgi:hypothetical protein